MWRVGVEIDEGANSLLRALWHRRFLWARGRSALHSAFARNPADSLRSSSSESTWIGERYFTIFYYLSVTKNPSSHGSADVHTYTAVNIYKWPTCDRALEQRFWPVRSEQTPRRWNRESFFLNFQRPLTPRTFEKNEEGTDRTIICSKAWKSPVLGILRGTWFGREWLPPHNCIKFFVLLHF